MKHIYIFIVITFFQLNLIAQKEFHVFPKNDKNNHGKSIGTGSFGNPWDLQTALNQKSQTVNGGAIIWLHEGVYNGRFISTLKSTIANKYITVSAFKKDKVILNGNVVSNKKAVLTIQGNNVIFKDFEITWLGEFSRIKGKGDFQKVNGITHTKGGSDCKLINLVIYNNPGGGIGSWRQTNGSLISHCIIYNNGFVDEKGKAFGAGMYVQNEGDKTRLIKNNIIFNNYYKGVEIWSANRKANKDYVKNITLDNNVIFNSGLPSGHRTVDNIILATDDRNGINIAKNIDIKNNILYHNTDYNRNQVNGDAASLTIGFHANAPVENISIHNNTILGRNNALRILQANSLSFKKNRVYSGYVFLNSTLFKNYDPSKWIFNDNMYYTKKNKSFRVDKKNSYNLEEWKSKFNFDTNSRWQHIKSFGLNNVLDITQNEYKPNLFRVTLFSKEGKDVKVDFSSFKLNEGLSYKIIDIENRKEVLKTGLLDKSIQINFPMNNLVFEKPLHNDRAQKTLSNFGVFIVEFDKVEEPKRKSFFGRLFKRLF
ncbi:right-handed parallel beta-helix repeat-containing protein [uncultured Algibacter sp.]|uniref:right-handed parallel beta-helix repeat-containing protein n=1 Tax=uncultured Algibacter sp. TaxID=298659 RepID=UPI002616041C|nr:right-handed parallel beta-helix repeat-containing protein [uncultured Algibacter sp.]